MLKLIFSVFIFYVKIWLKYNNQLRLISFFLRWILFFLYYLLNMIIRFQFIEFGFVESVERYKWERVQTVFLILAQIVQFVSAECFGEKWSVVFDLHSMAFDRNLWHEFSMPDYLIYHDRNKSFYPITALKSLIKIFAIIHLIWLHIEF